MLVRLTLQRKGDDAPVVFYLYSLDQQPAECERLLDSIRTVLCAVTALGWGVDQVVADATLLSPSDLSALEGEAWHADTWRWSPASHAPPRFGAKRFRLATGDMSIASWKAISPRFHRSLLSILVFYGRDSDPLPRPCAVFKLVDANDDAYRYPHAKLIHIAGMVRHSAIKAMSHNPPPFINDPQWVNRVVRGKRDESAEDEHKQFSYVPIPSIGSCARRRDDPQRHDHRAFRDGARAGLPGRTTRRPDPRARRRG